MTRIESRSIRFRASKGEKGTRFLVIESTFPIVDHTFPDGKELNWERPEDFNSSKLALWEKQQAKKIGPKTAKLLSELMRLTDITKIFVMSPNIIVLARKDTMQLDYRTQKLLEEVAEVFRKLNVGVPVYDRNVIW